VYDLTSKIRLTLLSLMFSAMSVRRKAFQRITRPKSAASLTPPAAERLCYFDTSFTP
jgi:hypothetical protein